jgi:hypothetical protein
VLFHKLYGEGPSILDVANFLPLPFSVGKFDQFLTHPPTPSLQIADVVNGWSPMKVPSKTHILVWIIWILSQGPVLSIEFFTSQCHYLKEILEPILPHV